MAGTEERKSDESPNEEDYEEFEDPSPGWFSAGIEVTEDGSSDEEENNSRNSEEDHQFIKRELEVSEDGNQEYPGPDPDCAQPSTSVPQSGTKQKVASTNPPKNLLPRNKDRPHCSICRISFASSLAAEKHFKRVHIQKTEEESVSNQVLMRGITATTQESEKRVKLIMKDKFKDLNSDDESEDKNPLWWQLEQNPCLIANPEVYEQVEKKGEEAQKHAEKIDFRNKDMRNALKVPTVSVKQGGKTVNLKLKKAENSTTPGVKTGNPPKRLSASAVSISVVKPKKSVVHPPSDGRDKLSLYDILNLDPSNVPSQSQSAETDSVYGVEDGGGVRKVRIVKISSKAAMAAKLGGGKVISLQRPVETPSNQNPELQAEKQDLKRCLDSERETRSSDPPPKTRKLARTVADNKKLNQSPEKRVEPSQAVPGSPQTPKKESAKSESRPRRDGRARRSAAPTDFSAVYKLDQMVADIIPNDDGNNAADEDASTRGKVDPSSHRAPPSSVKNLELKRVRSTKGVEAAEKLGQFLRHNAELGRLKAVEEGIMTTERYVCILCGVSLLRKSDMERHVAILHYKFRRLGVPIDRIGLKRDLREEESPIFKKNSLTVKMAFVQSERLKGEQQTQKEDNLAQFLNKWRPEEPETTDHPSEAASDSSNNVPQHSTSPSVHDHIEVPAFAAEVALGEDGTMEKKVNLDPSGKPGRKPGPLSYMKGVTVTKERIPHQPPSTRPSIQLRGISAAPQVMKPAEVKPNLNLHRAFFSRGMPLPKHCRKVRLEIDIKDGEKRSMYQYQCDLCMGTFSDRPNIIGHLQTVHDVGFFPCKLCKTILPTTTELELHNKTKHEI